MLTLYLRTPLLLDTRRAYSFDRHGVSVSLVALVPIKRHHRPYIVLPKTSILPYQFLRGRVLLGHNTSFDTNPIHQEDLNHDIDQTN